MYITKQYRLWVCVAFSFLAGINAWGQNNGNADVSELISKLTVKEKIDFLCASAPAIDRFNIPAYDWWNECLHGVARSGNATVFPKPIGMGSTWDIDLVKRMADAISDEARVKYNREIRKKGYTNRYEGLTFFSPTLNIARDPRWGRTSECFSEDPLLTAEVGVAFVQGLQGTDPHYLKLVATPKHFVANNEENRRTDGSAEVDEVSLREYYFPAFRASVVKGKAASMMGAYNALNGVPCCANKELLTDVLRREWEFDGVVISDGSAVDKIFTHHKYKQTQEEGAAAALLAGCDMSLRDEYREGLKVALERQLISEEDIDLAVSRVLILRKRLGMFDTSEKNPYKHLADTLVECRAHRQLAYEAACKSIVLLKNEGILPVDAASVKKIGLIGDAFKSVYYGDYSGESNYNTTLLEAIGTQTGLQQIELLWASENRRGEVVPSANLIRPAKYEYEGKLGLTGEYWDKVDFEGKSKVTRHELTLDIAPASDGELKTFDKMSACWTSSLLPAFSGEHIFTVEGSGKVNVYLDKKLVMEQEIPNKGKASFRVNLMANKQYELKIECRQMNKRDNYCFLWELPEEADRLTVERVAEKSDLVVLFIRDDSGAEGRDRKTLSMKPEQVSLIEKVSRLNKNTILVLGSSTPLVLGNVAPNVKALLNIWIAGQGESQAVSDILFGKVNPSGKTPVTFFANEAQLPAMDDYHVRSGRSYQYFNGDILYPFGFGLSYSAFEYGAPQVKEKEIPRESVHIQVAVDIRNAGKQDGEEVVQCYVTSPGWEQEGLKQRLVGFQRVALKEGESKQLLLDIPMENLERWNTGKKQWELRSGVYRVSVVPNSGAKNETTFVVR